MIKNMVKLEHTVNGKTYQFLSENDAPLNDVKDALLKVTAYVSRIDDQIKEAQEKMKADQEAQVKVDAPVEEPKAA